MIKLLYSNNTRYGIFYENIITPLESVFISEGYSISHHKIQPNGNVFPAVEDKNDFIVAIGVNEHLLPIMDGMVFSVIPYKLDNTVHINYRFLQEDENLFTVKSVDDVSLGRQIYLYDLYMLGFMMRQLYLNKEKYFG